MTAAEFCALAGVAVLDSEVLAYAPTTDDLPAIATVKCGGDSQSFMERGFAVIREAKDGPVEGAYAIYSTNPMIVFGQLTDEEQERLRAESQAAAGMSEPIGQEAALKAHESQRPADAPITAEVSEEPLPDEALTVAAIECPICRARDGHTPECPQADVPDPSELDLPEGWG